MFNKNIDPETKQYVIYRLILLFFCWPTITFSQENFPAKTRINLKARLVSQKMTAAAKPLNLPTAEKHSNNSMTLQGQTFTSMHRALGAREGIAINFDISFAKKPSVPTADGRAIIAKLARAIKFIDPKLAYEIQGHTATLTQEKNNEELSLLRAKKVLYLLQVNGGVKNSLTLTSSGSKKPFTTNETADGKKINSRITIVNKGLIEF